MSPEAVSTSHVIRELCDWDPERNQPAQEWPDGRREGCDLPATVVMGSRGEWHLCEACALLPRFKRFKVRWRPLHDPVDGPARVAQYAPFDRERRIRQRDKRDDWKICRWCGCALTGRKTGWCSMDCVDEWKIRRDPSVARRLIAHRDRGVCAACGCDTDALYRFWICRPWQNYSNESLQPFRDILHEAWLRMFTESLGLDPGSRNELLVGAEWPYDRVGGYWDADHIHEVHEGGGGCGLDNLQTLCLHCHRKKSARKRSEIARKRRGESPGYQLEIFG